MIAVERPPVAIREDGTGGDIGTVMVVDDQPANLKLMEDMLRRAGYQVQSFPRGRMALAAAADHAPDLILLDINMPEMDGFEVCARLKSDPCLRTIPIIFLSAQNEMQDKVRAFRAGAMDYITKPFQIEEVHARVETQLELQRVRRSERDLLETTLNGAVKTLTDLLHHTGPALAARSSAILDIVVYAAAQLNLENRWQYGLAATLCLIGCITLPAESFERAYGWVPQGADEEMFRGHPENGARLVANIPRLETVGEMIRRQQTVASQSLPDDPATLGACLLRMAVELDRRMFVGLSFTDALRQLKGSAHGLPLPLLDAVKAHRPAVTAFDSRGLGVLELRVSMIVEDDVVTRDGSFLILGRGSVLNATAIDKIRNFDRTRGIRQPIRVQVPRREIA